MRVDMHERVAILHGRVTVLPERPLISLGCHYLMPEMEQVVADMCVRIKWPMEKVFGERKEARCLFFQLPLVGVGIRRMRLKCHLS